MRFVRPIIWLVSLLLVVSLTRSVASLLEKRNIVRVQEEQLQRLEAENKQLQDALTQAETPEFVERVAREKLGLVKDGETIVILPQQQVSVTQTSEKIPNWKQWWGLFF